MTALRIQIASAGITWTTNYDFEDVEVDFVGVKPSARSSVLISDVQAPSVQDLVKVNINTNMDQTKRIFDVRILHYYKSTEAKVKAIMQSSGMCRVYYKYNIDPTASYRCLLLPDYSIEYIWGEKKVKISSLEFYQNSSEA